jgi:tRNA (guanosine-2'-O-)-methyltransferase
VRRRSENVLYPAGVIGAPEPWPEGWTLERVVEALEPLVTEGRRTRLQSVIGSRLSSVTVVMDAPHDPHNGGAVLRSADAFGVSVVHVVARTEAFALSTTVTRGSEKWVDLAVHRSASDAIAALHGDGFELVATHPEGELLPEDLAGVPRLAVVLGNERDGICRELEQAARRSVRVPMRGYVESLNVSVTAAIILASATRNRPGDLSEHTRAHLYARGLYQTVTHAAEVLAAHDHSRARSRDGERPAV